MGDLEVLGGETLYITVGGMSGLGGGPAGGGAAGASGGSGAWGGGGSGGGGSSYVGTLAGGQTQSGVRAGDGEVTITCAGCMMPAGI